MLAPRPFRGRKRSDRAANAEAATALLRLAKPMRPQSQLPALRSASPLLLLCGSAKLLVGPSPNECRHDQPNGDDYKGDNATGRSGGKLDPSRLFTAFS